MKQPTCEILKWRAVDGTTDEHMRDAMESLAVDVRQLPGFLQQTLYKGPENEWICIYYWESAQQAHDSNAAVADKRSFLQLMNIIDANSVSMEVMDAVQHSGDLHSGG